MKSRLPLQRLACLLLCLTVAMTAACGSKRTVPTREGESPEWMGTIRDLRTFPQDLTPFARRAGGSTPLLSEQEQQIQDARFNRIFFTYMYPDGMTADAVEDHVWMDGADFASFAVGDSVSFYAEVYRYLKTGNGKQLAFDDPRSRLFFVFADILAHVRKANPSVRFLFENVNMKREYLRVISEYCGVDPVRINSELVSAQKRDRWYWTDIRTRRDGLFGELCADIPQPTDLGLTLQDILDGIDVSESPEELEQACADLRNELRRRPRAAQA